MPARPRTAHAEHIETIRRNGEHLLTIINDILDVSKIEVGKMEVESIPTPAGGNRRRRRTPDEGEGAGEGDRTGARCLTPIPETITSDPIRLRQILVNLAGNAIKFTERGRVAIELAHDADAGALRIDVIDSGIGIAPEKVRTLFNPFEQADTSTTRRYGGTGLGLHISHELARMLGGDITVTSREGVGSTFTLTVATGALDGVPMRAADEALRHAPAATPISAEHDADGRPLAGVHILFAEDGPDNQRLIRHHLERAGATVTLAENGRLALEALTTDDGQLLDPCPFDVLLSDMQMPELDGYELTRTIRARGGTLPIVALTAHAMSGDAEKCHAAGCDAYATKPVDREALIRVCADAARGSSTTSS